jgi:hypothetical protein
MKNGLSLILLGGIMTLPTYAQQKSAEEIPLHVQNSFALTVHAPYSVAAPLFGPNGERGWSEGHWDPKFLFPQPGEDVQGAVFTIQHGPHKTIWINTVFDLQARHFQYVYFLPDLLVTTIDVDFKPVDGANTKVFVTYQRTALSAEANETVKSFGESDRNNGPQWEKAVNDYLSNRK